jgi:hypothetical protein
MNASLDYITRFTWTGEKVCHARTAKVTEKISTRYSCRAISFLKYRSIPKGRPNGICRASLEGKEVSNSLGS